MVKVVRTIPATLDKNTSKPMSTAAHRRVAGYARVSTDNEDQTNSYEAQVDYYTEYIQNRADWNFVKVYTDDGISGTSTAKRTGFNTMIKDALDGKIDLIVTKSVSRFARNTVDSLSTIRKLKDNGVEVYFEKENIWTFDSSGELLLTIMSSLSQEESRSISLNVTWGVRKGMQDGKVHVAFSNFLGYDRGKDGNLVINEEQAEVVRRIFAYYMQGISRGEISKRLMGLEIDTARGCSKWTGSSIDRILKNEKYKGDALLQKTFTTDYLTKKKKCNEGEVPQYYVEGNHPAIINPAVFDWVQDEIGIRGAGYSGKLIFSSRMVCEECGGTYVRKVWHSKENYKHLVWQCGCKYQYDRNKQKGIKADVCIPNPVSRHALSTAEDAAPGSSIFGSDVLTGEAGRLGTVEVETVEKHGFGETAEMPGKVGRIEKIEIGKKGKEKKVKKVKPKAEEQTVRKANWSERPWDWTCPSPSFHESDVKKAFVRAVNKLLQGREEAITAFELAKTTIFDTSALEIDLVSVNAEIKGATMRMRAMEVTKLDPDAYEVDNTTVKGTSGTDEVNNTTADEARAEPEVDNSTADGTENGRADEADNGRSRIAEKGSAEGTSSVTTTEEPRPVTYMDVTADAKNESMMAMRMRLNEAKQRQEYLKRTIKNKRKRRVAVDEYVTKLKEMNGRITEFSSELFCSLVDFIKVKKVGEYTNELTFCFLDGTEVKVNI